MKLKKANAQTMVSYAICSMGIGTLGAYMNNELFVAIGLFVALIGMIFATKQTQNQIIYNLKKNNMWDDEIPKREKKEKKQKVKT